MQKVTKAKQSSKQSKAVKTALVDGLLSDSATHIQMLLQSQDQQLMTQVMQQLAVRSIDGFLRSLTDIAAKHPQSAERALRWLNKLVESHSGYIASSPELSARLVQLRGQLQTRLSGLQRLLALKGRLDLLLSLRAGGEAARAARPPVSPVQHQDGDSDDDDDGGEVSEGEEDEGEDEEADDLAGQLLGRGGDDMEEAGVSGSDDEADSETGDEEEMEDGADEDQAGIAEGDGEDDVDDSDEDLEDYEDDESGDSDDEEENKSAGPRLKR